MCLPVCSHFVVGPLVVRTCNYDAKYTVCFFSVETSTFQTILESYHVSHSFLHRYYAVDFKVGEHAVTILQSGPLLCIDRQWGGTRLAVEGELLT